MPRVQFVRVEPDSKAYQRPIEDMFGQFQDRTLDPDALKAQVDALYGRGDLEMLDYRLMQDAPGRFGLDFSARRNSCSSIDQSGAWRRTSLRVAPQSLVSGA